MQFAILGSHPNLSLAELTSITNQVPLHHADKVALFNSFDTELSNLQKKLGGVQKLGFIIGSSKTDDYEGLIDLCTSVLLEKATDQKIKFGFSVYDIRNPKGAQNLRGQIERIGLEVKKSMKAAGKNARLVTSKEPQLSSVVVTKNKLLQTGAEFILIVNKVELLIGFTEAVQDFEDWSHRDYDRPARDARRGMLPPKLARMMVNLGDTEPEKSTILDPFCGSGTVLMEASMLGFKKMLGSDIQKQAVDDTEKNLIWLSQQGIEVTKYQLAQSSAEKIADVFPETKVDVIVTEPFLGKPRQGTESVAMIEKTIAELEELYKKSFTTLFELLKSGGTLVVASPVHFIGGREFAPDTKAILKKIGFSPSPASETRLLYHQKDQFVARDLLRFKKV
ncbi:MAG: DNA methyltransferase [Patescibacteria group bacterium]|nr:methyltransferase domain-containing protein [Patescibacteria group bacterium]